MTDTQSTILATIIVTVISILIICTFILFKSYSCEVKWADSGHDSRFSILGGCQIKLADGTWIPASAYREIP